MSPTTTDHGEQGHAEPPEPDYAGAYSEDSLWQKITAFAAVAGKKIIELVLILYYCWLDPDTPPHAKAIILGALGYFITPLDAIPDLMPGVGYSDDLGALGAVLGMIAVHIKPEHRQQAEEKLKTLFG